MPYRFASLRPDNDARLPAALALLLAALLGVQLALTGEVELPPPDILPGPRPAPPVPAPAPVRVPDATGRRPIFAGVESASDAVPGTPGPGPGTGTPPADPTGGLSVVGTVRIGRVAYALVQRPGVPARRVSVGDRVAGWTLAELSNDAASFVRGRRRVRIGVGAGPTPANGN